jgi:hypothetical protein
LLPDILDQRECFITQFITQRRKTSNFKVLCNGSFSRFQFNVFVFSPLVLGCLFITILLVGATVAFRKKSIHGFWDAFSMASQKDGTARHFKSPFIILGFLVILLGYQAAANSQRLTRIGTSTLSNIVSSHSETMVNFQFPQKLKTIAFSDSVFYADHEKKY